MGMIGELVEALQDASPRMQALELHAVRTGGAKRVAKMG